MRATTYPKPCPGCGKNLPMEEYGLKKTGGVARRGRCKGCCNSERNAWRGRDRPAARAKYRESYYKRKDLHPDFNRQVGLRKNYGMSLEEFDALLAAQSGVCAICKTKEPRGRHNQFVVDHDHKTDAIRGLLCNTCNLVLGLVDDDKERLEEMAKYLERTS